MTQRIPQPPARRAPRRFNRTKWILAGAGLGMLVMGGCLLALLVLGPAVYRGLSVEWRDRLLRRAPFLVSFEPTPDVAQYPKLLPEERDRLLKLFPYIGTYEPTRAYSAPVLPTLAATSDNALALLATDTPPALVPSPTTNQFATQTSLPPAQTPTPTLKPATQIVGALPTNTAPARPSLVPSATPTATATPIPRAAITATLLPPPTFTPGTPVSAAQAASPSPEPTMTTTLAPTVAPTLQPTFTPFPIPARFRLGGMEWVPQTWNNCGPANVTQALQVFKWGGNQQQVAAVVKPNKEDKNVSPWELVNFVNRYTKVRAINRSVGNLDLVKRLIYQKFPVLLETGLYDETYPDHRWIGHYLTIVAYDDPQGRIFKLDTYKGELGSKYADLDVLWQHFNRQYIVLYAPERERELAAILGPDMDLTYNAQHSLAVARAEATAQPDNPFAWFNLGTSFVMLGRHQEAARAYDQAFGTGSGLPTRMLWYQFGPFEAYYNVGRYKDVMRLVEVNLGTTEFVEETFYWQGMADAALGQMTDSILDLKRALEFNPNFKAAADMLAVMQSGKYQPPVPVARAG